MKVIIISKGKRVLNSIVILLILVSIAVLTSNTLFANEASEELKSLPKDYPLELAIKNGDVIVDPYGNPINMDRFYQFLDNIESKKPDKIRFASYTFEGHPPQVYLGILEFDGEEIIYTRDSTRALFSGKGTINKYTGIKIESEVREDPQKRKSRVFLLLNPPSPRKPYIFSFYIEKKEED